MLNNKRQLFSLQSVREPKKKRSKEGYRIINTNESIDGSIKNALGWVRKQFIANEPEYGWSFNSETITLWGGTTEALNALLAAGVSANDYQVVSSIQSIMRLQQEDGTWASLEVAEGNVVVTACVLSLFSQLRKDRLAECEEKMVQYLISCQKESGGWAFSKSDNYERVYISVLVLNALKGYRDTPIVNASVEKGIKWLVECENDDYGWGYNRGDQRSEIAITALVAILLSDLNVEKERFAKAIELIVSKMKNYKWDDEQEIYGATSDYGQNMRIHTTHASTAWALMALSKEENPRYEIIEEVVKALVKKQNADGGWYLKNQESYVWYVSNIVIALCTARNVLYSPVYLLHKMEEFRENLFTKQNTVFDKRMKMIKGLFIALTTMSIVEFILIVLLITGSIDIAVQYGVQVGIWIGKNLAVPIIVTVLGAWIIDRKKKSQNEEKA